MPKIGRARISSVKGSASDFRQTSRPTTATKIELAVR